ncbi:MAG: cohesin domain-containing protein [Myxococcota bacterium]|nr:cohesin domain-containing protein [Myxococcota bacterium]
MNEGRLVATTLALSLVALHSAGAVTLGFDPSEQTVGLGAPVSVEIRVADLDGEIVSAYDLDVVYDATVLSAVGVSFGVLLGDAAALESIDVFDLGSPGLVDLAQVSLLADADLAARQPDAFTLATVEFTAIALGESSLTFRFDPFNDVKGLEGKVLPLDPASGLVRVVPEPGTALVLALGLVVLARRSRGGC